MAARGVGRDSGGEEGRCFYWRRHGMVWQENTVLPENEPRMECEVEDGL